MRKDRYRAWREAGLDAWKREAVRMVSRAADPVLDEITSVDDLTLTTYMDVHMESWHADRLVYLGDAAHATSPQLGQGCNLALIDAMVLADCLAAEPDLAHALDDYSRTRRRHVRFYQTMTRFLTPLFQSDWTILGWLRDASMWFPSAFPPTRKEMLRTMAGVKTGFVRGVLPP